MKFSMSEAWNDATAMMAANREVLLIVAGIFFFLPGLALAFGMADFQQLAMMNDPEAMEAAVLEMFDGPFFLLLLASVLAQFVGYLALLALLRDTTKPTVGEAIKTGLIGLLPAFAVYILVSIVTGILFVVLMLPAGASGSTAIAVIAVLIGFVLATYLFVKFSLAAPVIAIEKVYNPFRVLARSWRLSKGNSFRLFLFYVLIFIVYMVISMVVGVIVAALMFATGTQIAMIINAVLSGILGGGVAVVFVAVLAAIHRQLAGPSAAAVSETFE